MRKVLHGMTGVDLTTIDGIGVETAEIRLSEYGPDLHEFETEKQFVKHLRLAPREAVSGGKPLGLPHTRSATKPLVSTE